MKSSFDGARLAVLAMALVGCGNAKDAGTGDGGSLNDGSPDDRLAFDAVAGGGDASPPGRGEGGMVAGDGGTVWAPLGIGAGGFAIGLDIAPDGTKVVRTDSSGAYLWSG